MRNILDKIIKITDDPKNFPLIDKPQRLILNQRQEICEIFKNWLEFNNVNENENYFVERQSRQAVESKDSRFLWFHTLSCQNS